MSNLMKFALLLAVASCAIKPSIVKKPEINQIKRVAILSFTAPTQIMQKDKKGLPQGLSEENRKAIADQAILAYSSELKKLGWSLLKSEQISALKSYQESFAPKLSKSDTGIGKALNSLSASDAKNNFFSPTGLYPIIWDENKGQNGEMRVDWGNLSLEKTGTLKEKMQAVAIESGADAAILVQADFCFEDGNIWVGKPSSGSGSAVITGASAIYAVTPKGVEVVKMKRIPGPCAGENRVASESGTAMVKYMITYTDEKIKKMFQEVVGKNAANNVKMILDAMR